MAPIIHFFSILLLVFTCSALANVQLKEKKDNTKNGQKRLDIHGRYCNYFTNLSTETYNYI